MFLEWGVTLIGIGVLIAVSKLHEKTADTPEVSDMILGLTYLLFLSGVILFYIGLSST